MGQDSTRTLDIDANRKARKYTSSELWARAVWGMVGPFFRWSPRLLHGWRSLLLRSMGARIGARVHMDGTVRVFAPWALEIGDYSAVGERAIIYNLGPVRLGQRVTVSQGAHLCAGTHDHSLPSMPLVRLPITVEDDAWICAEAFVGPGVTVGKGAVVGARAVVVRDVPAWAIVAGNPARVIRQRVLKQQGAQPEEDRS